MVKVKAKVGVTVREFWVTVRVMIRVTVRVRGILELGFGLRLWLG